MLAAWKGGTHSSAGAREIGNVMSAYSPHPGLTPLSEREREEEKDQVRQLKDQDTKNTQNKV